MLRWMDTNDPGTDNGLGIDDFSVTAVPEPLHYGAILSGLLALIAWRRRAVRNRAA